ncbi:hypothetical protein AM493_18490 [Flavobacterium akiainvivens]|uniref:Outer membrane protein beta-barrel domain-containing protein n=1 Tax=Flavobacterium akiainvivens TaxID=1202724 RepID=A0A0M9VJJ5_9FLAO|nr:TonB-dependent receptor [Flavobacterium akiainvivens]KOS07819.1 hypothetical protein AM493_18490 [Flavobacterium akiainvivens]SFQ26984.1 Carboxypeptidase regulatory-like domain-containing protein [Flavobacterium akiainvivens]
MRLTISLIFMLCTAVAFGQNVVFKGKVTDMANAPLDGATIFLTKVKDSTVVEYTVSDSKGNWELKTLKPKDTINLKVAYTGLATYVQKLNPGTENRDFGTLKLEEQPTELDELFIEAEIPPIVIKNDTLEFNAASFKVRPNAKVEELIKKLPGVSISNDGKITFNGREVNQFLVDGKPFFGTDGAVALENLPAEIIDKVQVTDLKTKQEEMTGQKAKSQDASINLTLKKDRKKGVFGTIAAGYGTNGRYEAALFANYFNDTQRISLTGSSNNINSFGLGMDFGGRGRGSVRAVGGAIGGFGGGNGLSVSSSAGVNYSDEWIKDSESTISYSNSINEHENRSRSESINYTPEETDPVTGEIIDSTYRSNESSSSKGSNYSHNVDGQFRFKIDSTTNIMYMPRFSTSEGKSNSVSESMSERLSDSRLLNDSEAQSYSENNGKSFTGSVNLYKYSKAKKGRGLSAVLTHNNRSNYTENNNRSVTNSYTYSGGTMQTSTDDRNQVLYNNNSNDSYSVKLEYFEPVTDSLRLSISADLGNDKSVNNRQSYDFDPVTGRYTVYNDSLSNYLSSNTFSVVPQVGLMLDKKKYSINLDAGVNYSAFRNFSDYLGTGFSFTKNYLLPAASMRAAYKFERFESLDFFYNYSANFPQGSQILPVRDLSNPLNTTVGNPDLDPSTTHSFRLNYRNFGGGGSKAGYNIMGGVTFFGNQVVRFTTINESAQTETSYRNISGAMNANLGINWNKYINRDDKTLSINLNLFGNYGSNKGFLNGREYNSRSLSLTPSAFISYDYTDYFNLTPTYSMSFSMYDYQNYSVNSSSSMVHRFALQATSYWPKNLMFANDLSYTYNPQVPDNFRRGFLFWNTALAYSVLDEKLMFKVKVYDVLNQNNGVQRNVGPTVTTDQENLVLKRYVMFTLTYKLDAFGGKSKKD